MTMGLFQKKFLFISVSLLLYVASCFIPAYSHFIYGEDILDGWECLSMGFFTWDYIKDYINPFPLISWLSNLPFYIGLFVLLFSRRRKGFSVAAAFLFISLLMSLGALLCYGDPKSPFFPKPGCIVWIFSQFMLFTGAFILKREYTLNTK